MLPKYLYHYTSIETLKKIIETRTIKFTRLDKLNDPKEGIIAFDKEQIEFQKRVVYCSCFSTEENNISMWYIYTKMKGARIKFKSNLFGEFNGLKEHTIGFIPYSSLNVPIGNEINDGQVNQKFLIKSINGPIKMIYHENEEQFYKQSFSISIEKPNCNNQFKMGNIDIIEIASKNFLIGNMKMNIGMS